MAKSQKKPGRGAPSRWLVSNKPCVILAASWWVSGEGPNVETRRDEYTFLGSGCNIRTHLLRAARARPRVYFIERDLGARWLTTRSKKGIRRSNKNRLTLSNSPIYGWWRPAWNLSFEGRVRNVACDDRLRLRQSRQRLLRVSTIAHSERGASAQRATTPLVFGKVFLNLRRTDYAGITHCVTYFTYCVLYR